jgi:hypothetical protein
MRTVCGFLDQEIKPETLTQTQISATHPHHHQKDHAILNPSSPSPLLLEKKLLPFQLDYHLRPAAAAAHPGNIPKHLAS